MKFHKPSFFPVRFNLCLAAIGIVVSAASPAWAQAIQRVIATVNDAPITAYDLSQRVRFTTATTGRKTSQKMSRQILQLLVSEKLQMQEAKRVGVTVSDKEVKASLTSITKRNKINLKRLTAHLKSRGIKIKTLENKIKAELAWSSVIRRKFRHLVSVGESDIKLHLSKTGKKAGSGDASAKTVVLELQKLTVLFTQGRTELELKNRLYDAEKLRASFKTCRRWRAQSRVYRNVKAKYIPEIKLEAIEEPMRSVVAKTRAGQVTPPQSTSAGLEIIAVCNRKEQSAQSGQRDSVVNQLKNQQFSQFSQRHLRDLRRDAVIEFPNQAGKNPYALKPSNR